MNDEARRFHDRFQALFENEGLENVKFFVRSDQDARLADLIKDVNRISETIAANEFSVVKSLDANVETREFDEKF